MSSPAARERRSVFRTLLRWLPGLLITSLALVLLFRMIDWEQFTVSLAAIPVWVILLTIALYFVSIIFRSLAWQFLLQRKVTLAQAFLTLNEGYFFNNVLPFRIGELARAFLMGRRSHLGLFNVLSTIMVERFYDLAIAAGLLLATLPFALKLDWARPVASIILAAIVTALLMLFFAARKRDWVESHAVLIGGRWGWFNRWVLPQIHSVLDGFSVLTRVEFFAGSLALLLGSWFTAVLRDWVLIRIFVPAAPLWWAALGLGAANMVGAVPSVMGALGTFELGGTGALTLVGMPGEAALAYLLLVHVIHLIISTLIGAYGLSQEGQTLSSLYADIRHSR
ncbi:MAG: flippase-like domain-containing protein [Anaerolineaceae bacterium]|nr:flippase-like domain-containing protein [Anaerolineaceae bacterium]